MKEVEKIVLSSQLEAKCDDPLKLTPRELFTKEHKDLRKDGEAWMRNTANSCMLVSTLIATVIFAAAFTIPGGDDNEGTPIFQKRFWFTIFVISDAVGLISSSSSILVFLSILTSRHAEDDFLHSLPSRLLIGLTSLFISIVCMVVAFSATFFMHYHNNANIWVPKIVATTTIVPVCCFCMLQFKLWVDIFHNTYLSKFLFRYPDIVWEEDDDGKSIFHVAVEHRLEDVSNLIYEIGGLKDFSAKYRITVKGKYNILHLAAKLAAPNHLNRVSGAVLQMQRELLWYKTVFALSIAYWIHCHNNANVWVPKIVATTTIDPVCCFCVLQFKLWVDIYHNTYLSKYLFRPRQRKLSSSPFTLPLPKAIACSEANSAS
ncbi:hypothetical protein Csa_000077 [Cucumis sativus]|nr:hypothetical protein Csa_000077 [Cucumis sativus]